MKNGTGTYHGRSQGLAGLVFSFYYVGLSYWIQVAFPLGPFISPFVIFKVIKLKFWNKHLVYCWQIYFVCYKRSVSWYSDTSWYLHREWLYCFKRVQQIGFFLIFLSVCYTVLSWSPLGVVKTVLVYTRRPKKSKS